MKIDLNSEKYLSSLEEAVRSFEGEMIINFFQYRLNKMKAQRKAINLKMEDKLVGQEYRRLETAIIELEDIINFLNSKLNN